MFFLFPFTTLLFLLRATKNSPLQTLSHYNPPTLSFIKGYFKKTHWIFYFSYSYLSTLIFLGLLITYLLLFTSYSLLTLILFYNHLLLTLIYLFIFFLLYPIYSILKLLIIKIYLSFSFYSFFIIIKLKTTSY